MSANVTKQRQERTGTSCTNCCVVGCKNNYSNTDKNVKFYCFPSKPHEKKRRELWIQSVRRKNSDGTPWHPAKFSRICSQHFVNNEKSNHPNSPSYVPTIFPKAYKKVVSTELCRKRFNNFAKRAEAKKRKQQLTLNVETNENIDSHNLPVEKSKDFVCQVNFIQDQDIGNSCFIFEALHCPSNEVATQVNISEKRDKMYKTFSEKKVGPDQTKESDLKCIDGFHGYHSIKTDEQLSSLCGVYFDLLFSLLKTSSRQSHGNEKLLMYNKLVMFLMKVKHGLSYSALGVLFGIHRTTVSKIFVGLLSELVQKTGNYVFWPSKRSIINTMPKAFRIHYPQCRVIIDCSEIKIQQPHSIENRVYTYSHYKGTFTAKFLVGISPNGFVSFISKCYGGRSSDAFITNDSGILSLLESGDTVLADKGFPGIRCEEGIIIVMPPFVHDGRLTEEEIHQTYSVASVRIHVERSIQRIKTYEILSKLTYDLFPYVDDILHFVCVLVNLQPPIIAPNEEN